MVAPHMSRSIQALHDNALSVWPGMTIFWIGDTAHQGEVSGHNPDDTPGLQAELTDADTDPEVRALDFMIGSHFTPTDAANLTDALVKNPERYQRTYYVIYDHKIYKKSNDFKPTTYTGTDPHTNHVHHSGLATDDENGHDWQCVLALGADMTQPWNEAEVNSTVSRTGAIFLDKPTATWANNSGTTATETNALSALLHRMESKLDALVAAGGGGGVTPPSFTVDDIRQVVREELDKTKLSS